MSSHRFYHQNEDQDAHELEPTHYHQSNHFNHPQYPTRNQNQNQNHNAFGDDSDSEPGGEHHDQQYDPAPAFDVYKDFNNQGVRYTTLLKQPADELNHHQDNEDHSSQDASNKKSADLSPEKYQKSHLSSDQQLLSRSQSIPNQFNLNHAPLNNKNISRASPKRLLAELKNGKNRWRIGSIIAFISLACAGVLVFFLEPRAPFISYEIPVKLTKRADDESQPFFSARNPTNFSFDGQLEMALDGRASYLPTLIRNFRITINDLGSTPDSVQVAKGRLSKGFTAGTRNLTPLTIDVNFEYNTKLPSDLLWQAWRKACGNIAESTVNGTITRPSLQLYIVVSFNVIGLIGTRYDSTTVNNVGCPVELPAGAPSF